MSPGSLAGRMFVRAEAAREQTVSFPPPIPAIERWLEVGRLRNVRFPPQEQTIFSAMS